MFDSMLERASDSLLQVVQTALDECQRMKNRYVCTEHILLGLATGEETIPAQVLSSMKIDSQAVRTEVEGRLKEKPESELLFTDRLDFSDPAGMRQEGQTEAFNFSDLAVRALLRAEDYCRFFGLPEIQPEHLLLAITDLSECGASKIFEELGANVTFIRRQTMQMMAIVLCSDQAVPSLFEAVSRGLRGLIEQYYSCAATLNQLSARSRTALRGMPGRSEVVHMVCVAYLGDFLCTQVAFQRYMLEETLRLLFQRTGQLDKELSASLITAGAQNMRSEARATIEYLLSQEYRLFNQMLSDAEHDLIGSLIEDLWWAQSEEMAINELFAEAMEDHRRKQLLSLQKRRIEITQRLVKVKARLDETLRQCFVKRSISA